jgi:hypothetical protein
MKTGKSRAVDQPVHLPTAADALKRPSFPRRRESSPSIFMDADRFDELFTQMSTWIKEEKITFREDIIDGLENAPAAFIGLLEGQNFGTLIVRAAVD